MKDYEGKRCSNCKWWKRHREKWTGRFLDGGHCSFELPLIIRQKDDVCLDWEGERRSCRVDIVNYGTPAVRCGRYLRDVYGDHGCVTCKYHDRIDLQRVYCYYTEDMSEEDKRYFNARAVQHLQRGWCSCGE